VPNSDILREKKRDTVHHQQGVEHVGLARVANDLVGGVRRWAADGGLAK
jgi:hypothetical protein